MTTVAGWDLNDLADTLSEGLTTIGIIDSDMDIIYDVYVCGGRQDAINAIDRYNRAIEFVNTFGDDDPIAKLTVERYPFLNDE